MERKSVKSWIWNIMRPDVGYLVALSVLSALSACCGVGFALLSRQVLDIAVGETAGDIWLYSGFLLLLLLLQIALDMIVSYATSWISGRMDMRIKDTVFSALFRKQYSSVSAYHSGDLMNRVTGDVQVVVNAMATLAPRTVSFATRLVACVAVLFALDWRFTVVMLGLSGAVLFGYRVYGKKAKLLHRSCQETDGHTRAYMQESMENWMVVQSFDGGEVTRRRLAKLLRSHFSAVLRRARWSNISSGALRLVFSGGYYMALAWGAFRLSTGMLTYGTLMAFMQIVLQIRMPMVNMSGLLPQYYNMLASAERLLELENLPEEPRTAALSADAYKHLQCLRISDVYFAYDAEHPVLSGASLTIQKGEFVALAGFSGIGKSTLFKLLLGFYTPASGRVEMVTADGAAALGADTRPLFAYVPQQNMLLSGTIRENIAMFSPKVTEENLWQAAEIADIADAIRQMPDGLDTLLGERGVGLSEGQLQRLAIARAVLSGAPILLLDESTSSLDEDTEQRVLRNLRRLPGKTCLCISHRPAALNLCDRVIRVDNGMFVE